MIKAYILPLPRSAELSETGHARFRAKANTKWHRRFHTPVIEDIPLIKMFGVIIGLLDGLKNVPWEGSISVSVTNGEAKCEGTVNLYSFVGRGSHAVFDRLVHEVEETAKAMSQTTIGTIEAEFTMTQSSVEFLPHAPK